MIVSAVIMQANQHPWADFTPLKVIYALCMLMDVGVSFGKFDK